MERLKILHLAKDEKFIDMGVEAFERVFPGRNDLYIRTNKKLKYVKKIIPKKIVGRFETLVGVSKNDFKNYDVVILHSLHKKWFRSILKIPKEIPVVWIGWGFDYYDIIFESRNALLLEKTRNVVNQLKSKKKGILEDLLKPSKPSVINRINFFSPVIPEEFQMTKQKCLTNHFPDQCFWNYGNLEDNYTLNLSSDWVEGHSILLGNSASDTNNHLDVFDYLKESQQRIVMPLSYGNLKYRDQVIVEAQSRFGKQAVCLVDFMPLDQYLKLISECGYVIMNHVRQQGLGNIITMLYLGAKIFLREENPVYQYLTSRGAVVFKISDIAKSPDSLQTPLNDEQRKINRNIMIEDWCKKTADKKTRALIELVCKKNTELLERI